MEPKSLGNDPLLQSWLLGLPTELNATVRKILNQLFDMYAAPCLSTLRRFNKELVPTVDCNLVQSTMRILDCFYDNYVVREGDEPFKQEDIDKVDEMTEPLFIFALTWSICATVNEAGRERFDAFVRNEMLCHGAKYPFPDKGMIYDYTFNMETMAWQNWMETVDEFHYDSKLTFSEIIVPTKVSLGGRRRR